MCSTDTRTDTRAQVHPREKAPEDPCSATCLTLLFSCRPPALARSSLPALHLSVGYLPSSPFHSTFQTIQEEYLVCLGEGQKLTQGRKSVQDLETAGFIKDIKIETPSKVLEDVRSQWVCASVVWCVCVCLSLSLSLSLCACVTAGCGRAEREGEIGTSSEIVCVCLCVCTQMWHPQSIACAHIVCVYTAF